MTCTTDDAQNLRKRGFRMTPQRLAVLHILKDSGEHLSPSEIIERAQQVIPGMTETTVYRTLEFLSENGLVMPSLQADGHLTYEDASHAHHHLVCRNCNMEVSVEHEMLQELYDQLEADTGFDINTSHLTFLGICPGCQKNRGNS